MVASSFVVLMLDSQVTSSLVVLIQQFDIVVIGKVKAIDKEVKVVAGECSQEVTVFSLWDSLYKINK